MQVAIFHSKKTRTHTNDESQSAAKMKDRIGSDGTDAAFTVEMFSE